MEKSSNTRQCSSYGGKYSSFLGTPSASNCESQNSVSCICPKLLNFESSDSGKVVNKLTYKDNWLNGKRMKRNSPS